MSKANLHVGPDGHGYSAGTATHDYVVGHVGRDCLYGRGGNDLVVGGAGNDWLYGNWLSGEGEVTTDEQNYIVGGPGTDYMYGASGNNGEGSRPDIFVFGKNHGFDTVFANWSGRDEKYGASDKIDLRGLDGVTWEGLKEHIHFMPQGIYNGHGDQPGMAGGYVINLIPFGGGTVALHNVPQGAIGPEDFILEGNPLWIEVESGGTVRASDDVAETFIHSQGAIPQAVAYVGSAGGHGTFDVANDTLVFVTDKEVHREEIDGHAAFYTGDAWNTSGDTVILVGVGDHVDDINLV